ncbi:MAG: substrate-binding domain-containing protein [Betaproteobacteria bacterium]|nr:substrate-binding domain-containing protein [Betaproteobacteria bacterium]
MLVLFAWALTAWPAPVTAAERYVTVASTTSTEQSGLFRHILPIFEKKTGIRVRVVALGTGQALDMARRGDADVVFVHAREQEEKFLAEEYGVRRCDVMYNDFVLVGPRSDPARVGGGKDIVAAVRKIKEARAPFVSRGDRSGTHVAELKLWRLAGIEIAKEKGRWYRDTGQGMGPALNTAASMSAYILSDRGTWLSFRNRGELAILVEGDKRLFNQYGIMLVNPQKHPHVKREWGQAFIDWVTSSEGQRAIAAYRIGGEQLFFPNAARGNNPDAGSSSRPGA